MKTLKLFLQNFSSGLCMLAKPKKNKAAVAQTQTSLFDGTEEN